MKRRTFLQQSTLTGAAFIVSKYGFGQSNDFAEVRVARGARHFTSEAVEKVIEAVQKKTAAIKNSVGYFTTAFPIRWILPWNLK